MKIDKNYIKWLFEQWSCFWKDEIWDLFNNTASFCRFHVEEKEDFVSGVSIAIECFGLNCDDFVVYCLWKNTRRLHRLRTENPKKLKSALFPQKINHIFYLILYYSTIPHFTDQWILLATHSKAIGFSWKQMNFWKNTIFYDNPL